MQKYIFGERFEIFSQCKGLIKEDFVRYFNSLDLSSKQQFFRFLYLLEESAMHPDKLVSSYAPVDFQRKNDTPFWAQLLNWLKKYVPQDDRYLFAGDLFDWIESFPENVNGVTAKKIEHAIHLAIFFSGELYPRERIEFMIGVQRFKNSFVEPAHLTTGFILRWLHKSYLNHLFPGVEKPWVIACIKNTDDKKDMTQYTDSLVLSFVRERKEIKMPAVQIGNTNNRRAAHLAEEKVIPSYVYDAITDFYNHHE